MAASLSPAASLENYASLETYPAFLNQAKSILASGNVPDVHASRIAFGTAGLRARMGPGYCCMNDLVVLQTSQGLCEYVPGGSIVIGYDGRHNSVRFAEIVAKVFLSKGRKVYLFRQPVCTPLVPYGVLQLGVDWGVMITASHNPKDDNGYKVYFRNGAQIIPPHDSGIANEILRQLQPWPLVLSTSLEHAENPFEKVVNGYFSQIPQYHFYKQESSLRVVYTAMHGVGKEWVERAFRAFSLPPYIPVASQIEIDPEFPTVAFPNPEEKGALDLSIETAKRVGSPLILANDPDADRLAVAELDVKSGQYVVLSGNDIAALFAEWVWRHSKAGSKGYMVASTVSSKFLQAMAMAEGFQFADSLTGFKWIANTVLDMEKQGLEFLFAYEVELGYLVGNISYDKDGVRTAAIMYDIAADTYNKGFTLREHLKSLYNKYGYFSMENSYVRMERKEMDSVFLRLRKEIKPGMLNIKSIRDVTMGTDTSKKDGLSILPKTPKDQMITYTFAEPEGVVTLRNSGTEPKLKYYVECKGKDENEAKSKMNRLVAIVKKEMLRTG